MRLEDLVSVDRRRRRWRLRPIALVILGVVGVLLVASLAWGFSRIKRAMAIRPVPTPVATLPAAEGGDTIPTSVPEPYPVTWDVRRGQDAEGRAVGIVSDPAVREAVVRGFLEAHDWVYRSESPHNLDVVGRYFASLPEGSADWVFQPDEGWWLGLESVQADIATQSEQGVLLRTVTAGGEWDAEIERFSTNGKRAVVRARYTGECSLEVLNTQTGEWSEAQSQDNECWDFVAGMVYDTTDGRWKIATLRQFAPGPQEE